MSAHRADVWEKVSDTVVASNILEVCIESVWIILGAFATGTLFSAPGTSLSPAKETVVLTRNVEFQSMTGTKPDACLRMVSFLCFSLWCISSLTQAIRSQKHRIHRTRLEIWFEHQITSAVCMVGWAPPLRRVSLQRLEIGWSPGTKLTASVSCTALLSGSGSGWLLSLPYQIHISHFSHPLST